MRFNELKWKRLNMQMVSKNMGILMTGKFSMDEFIHLKTKK